MEIVHSFKFQTEKIARLKSKYKERAKKLYINARYWLDALMLHKLLEKYGYQGVTDFRKNLVGTLTEGNVYQANIYKAGEEEGEAFFVLSIGSKNGRINVYHPEWYADELPWSFCEKLRTRFRYHHKDRPAH